jgi:hypothetical protein
LIADAAAAGIKWGGNFQNPDPNHFFLIRAATGSGASVHSERPFRL